MQNLKRVLQRGAFIPVAALALVAGCASSNGSPESVPEHAPMAENNAAQETTTTPKVGDTAPDFSLFNLQKDTVTLSTFAENGPVALIVLRGYPGYQCPVCTRQVGELISKAKEFEKVGARVLLIYPGPGAKLDEHGEEFLKNTSLPSNFDLVLDPDYKMVNQYGLRWDAAKETAYPATFVLDKTRKVRFAKVSKTHGDRASVGDILAAMR